MSVKRHANLEKEGTAVKKLFPVLALVFAFASSTSVVALGYAGISSTPVSDGKERKLEQGGIWPSSGVVFPISGPKVVFESALTTEV